MQRTVLFLILVFLSGSASGCQPETQEVPVDFSLTYQWDSGSLPPEYHYSYTIQIDAQGFGQFTHQSGYEGEGAPAPWVTEFQIRQVDIQSMYALMIEKDLLRTNWEEGELSEGGQYRILQVIENSREYQIPSDASMKESDRKDLRIVSEQIESLVPPPIWEEMNRRQQAYENPVFTST